MLNWAHQYNGPQVADGADSRNKYVWFRDCFKHAAELTVQGANKSGSWVNCNFCTPAEQLPKGWAAASDHAKAAAPLVHALAALKPIITEAKVLGGTFGPFDFSVVVAVSGGSGGDSSSRQQWRRVEVEVDGEQHFTKAHHDTTPGQQLATDREKDAEAWRQGRCLVRLHYLDRRFWQDKLQYAAKLACSTPPQALHHLHQVLWAAEPH